MSFKSKYSIKDVIDGKANKDFNNDSVIFIRNLFDEDFCKDVKKYILENEKDIIEKFLEDKKGLVLDSINNKNLIKYFEYPFSYDRAMFGKFSRSNIYKIAETLLKEEVFIFSMELHSRIALGTNIPPHQDNAYYGLENGQALTFYIPLDDQNPRDGGLRYFSNPINNEFDHNISKEKGFSLTITDKNEINNLKKLNPYYNSGDCTVHHSRSVHFAESVPPNVQRGIVLRMSFYSVNDKQKSDHEEWYKKVVNQNRLL